MDCTHLFIKAKKASRKLNVLERDSIDKILLLIAEKAVETSKYIISENQKDLILMAESDPRYDRLILTEDRINSIASDIRNVVDLPSPLGHILMKNTRANGLIISKISVPFGVLSALFMRQGQMSHLMSFLFASNREIPAFLKVEVTLFAQILLSLN